MKRFLSSLIALVCLVATAHAGFILNSYRLSSAAPSIVFNGEFESPSGTVHTYTNAPVGTADATRLVVPTIACRGGGTTTLNSTTVDGNAASTVVQTASTNDDSFITQYALTTGTTATIVFTFSTSQSDCHICVYSLYNLVSQTATPTANQNNNTAAVSFAGSSGDIVISASTARAVSSIAWTGLTENASYFPGSGMSCASQLLAGSISSVTPDFNGTPTQQTVVAGWR